jgi:hypothetical protein
MTMYQRPILAAVAAQRQQELQREAKRWHWAELKGAAASIHPISAHWLSGAARRVGFRLPASREMPS